MSSVSCQGAVKTGPGIVHEGVSGVRWGRSPITAQPTHVPDRRPDLMERNFRAKHPHQLWVADITYVRTRAGFVYTAFVTDVFSRMIVGWST